MCKIDEMRDLIEIVNESKNLAKEHEWLYHCTNEAGLLGIIENRMLWLSNLQNVNDAEEMNRIKRWDYERSYYVGCFTYDADISGNHWAEYGDVLIGMKREWFEKRLCFLQEYANDPKRMREVTDEPIYNDLIEAKFKNHGYYVEDFGFYQVIYDDDLFISMCIEHAHGESIWPGVPGIIKKKTGICKREGSKPYFKNWEEEREVRIKVCIKTDNSNTLRDKIYYPKAAIKLSDKAFDEFRIKYSPDMRKETREEIREKIKKMLPRVDISDDWE